MRYLIFFIILVSTAPELGAVDTFGINDIDPGLRWGWATPDNIPLTVVAVIKYLAGFLYFVGVVLAVYAGFLILISWWDEEKVKKWKNIIIYVAIGLVIIFLAANIVEFIIGILNPTDPSAPTYIDTDTTTF